MARARLSIVLFERTRVTVRRRLVTPSGSAPPQGRSGREDPRAKPFLRSLLVDLAIACVCSAALVSLLGSTSPGLREKEEARARNAGYIRTVADLELVFARDPASPDEVRRSVASVKAFVEHRAGVSVNPAIAERLADLEQRTLDGRLRRLPVAELSDVFSEVLFERVRGLTDDEIESAASGFENIVHVGQLEELGDDPHARFAMAKRMRGIAGDVARKRPEWPRNDVMLRYDGNGRMPADRFAAKLREIRERLQLPAVFLLVESQGREVVQTYLDERLAIFESALPETWGASRSSGLTPLQTVLTAYSAASDDYLAVTSEQLAEIQQSTIDDYLPFDKRSQVAARRAPFGRNGDLFSTPLDLVFNDVTLTRLLDEIEERASK